MCVAESQGVGEPILWSEKAGFIFIPSHLGMVLGKLLNPADTFFPAKAAEWVGSSRGPHDINFSDESQHPRERQACLLICLNNNLFPARSLLVPVAEISLLPPLCPGPELKEHQEAIHSKSSSLVTQGL